METESLRLFIKVAEVLNISAAGKSLGLAPAIASSRLSKLENQIGADLFHRSTRKITLSTQGEQFLPYAREILKQHDAALNVIGKDPDDASGTIRFAVSSTFAQLYIVPILPEFLDRNPNITIDLKLGDKELNIIEHGIDLALRNSAIKDSGLRARKLADDRRILCASPDYLSRKGMPGEPTSLINHDIIMFKDAKPRKLHSNRDNSAMFPPDNSKIRLICDDGTSMRIATAAGIGISMNAYWSVYHDLKAGKLVQVLPNYEVEDNTSIWLVYPKANALSPKVRLFIDYLIDKFGSPPSWER
ncbi:LysR family transcriptional regulator [Vibrio sp. SCSIO 43140]|uniref:LysR family transcriptional regulator n=1 Tax=Vibrio sp. SCSIO 43140 TaxID=2819100 RepID=UPI0020753366|nr:LysR family transcriptional regulator [Vibrio sp. SCSIO 43140]USD63120.1 LysR family transcriptional regulator [Vibrio sp. SCSIO 43140]